MSCASCCLTTYLNCACLPCFCPPSKCCIGPKTAPDLLFQYAKECLDFHRIAIFSSQSKARKFRTLAITYLNLAIQKDHAEAMYERAVLLQTDADWYGTPKWIPSTPLGNLTSKSMTADTYYGLISKAAAKGHKAAIASLDDAKKWAEKAKDDSQEAQARWDQNIKNQCEIQQKARQDAEEEARLIRTDPLLSALQGMQRS